MQDAFSKRHLRGHFESFRIYQSKKILWILVVSQSARLDAVLWFKALIFHIFEADSVPLRILLPTLNFGTNSPSLRTARLHSRYAVQSPPPSTASHLSPAPSKTQQTRQRDLNIAVPPLIHNGDDLREIFRPQRPSPIGNWL